MQIREAVPADIPRIQVVRNSVKENMLSDPALVTDHDCLEYMTERGKAWVCEINDLIVGFAIVDMRDHNVWALFLHPEYEKKGIGRQLHDTMIDWYFRQAHETIWLGTAPQTRAEQFYLKAGWNITGTHGKGETKFEMTYKQWMDVRQLA